MSADEYASWGEANERVYGSDHAARPCRDCPQSYAIEMRALGRCNGTPGSPEKEDKPMQVMEPMVAARSEKEVTVAVTAPCATCLHEPVCVLRRQIKELDSIPVRLPPLGEGLAVVLAATIECRYYLRRPKPPGAARQISPKARARMRQGAYASHAIRRAKRDGQVA